MSTAADLLDQLAELIAAKVIERMSAPTDDAVLNVAEAGRRIGRTAGAVRQLVARGEIAAVRCGRRVQIEARELEAWRERNRT